jgi:glycosyltransferase involved in cell wall biosynthesis
MKLKKNVAVLFGIHGNIEGIMNKTSGDYTRVSEFLVIDKLSDRFENIFVFSYDSRNKENTLPKNASHVYLFNQIFYIIFGWLILLFFIHRNNIKWIYLECSALPLVFMLNKLSNAKVLLNYTYLLHKIYETEKNYLSLKNKITKNRFMPFIIKPIERFLLYFVDYVITSSTEIENFVSKDKVLNNKLNIKKGIIVSKFNPKITKHRIYRKIKGYSILSTSRIIKVKNPLTLIQAYKIAKRNIPNLHLIMCGDGELMEDCKKIADENVHLLGFVKDIPGFLKGADIFVLVPKYEASPRSLMEAMAMGVPCITSRVGGIPDYIDETCGVFVEPNNPEMLAEKIVYLIKNKKKARELGRRAREKILKYHDLDKNLDKVIDFMIKQAEKDNI